MTNDKNYRTAEDNSNSTFIDISEGGIAIDGIHSRIDVDTCGVNFDG